MMTSPKQRAAVREWIDRTAHPLVTAEPSAPLDDLQPLIRMLDDHVSVVGCGAGTRGAHELFTMQVRIARLLVGDAGFRAVALDQDWTLGVQLDGFVRTGVGDPRLLLGHAEPFSRTEEVLALVEWMRAFNETHADDPVRFVGLSPHEVGDLAYDTVVDYVLGAAPERVEELEGYYAELRPGRDVPEHTRHFRGLPDRKLWVDRARAAHALVAGVPANHDGYASAVHSARVIVQYYELHDHDDQQLDPHNMAYLEQALAENLLWWCVHTGHKALFWSSCSHTSNGRSRAITFPPDPARVSRNAGSYLRGRLGSGYASIGLIFGDGEVATYADTPPHRIPTAAPPLVESMLGADGKSPYLLDLGAEQPQPVAQWLGHTATVRAIGPGYDPDNDTAHHMTGGSLAEWFDTLIYHRHVTAARPLHHQGH